MKDMVRQLDVIKDYYGRQLKTNEDLKTSACCANGSLPKSHQIVLEKIHDDILSKFYGCGSPIPFDLKGRSLLDLGCGTGRDVYLASYLVGETGTVIGVDMTDEQLNVANRYVDSQMERFGFSRSNVIFKKGYIEDLASIDIADNSVDVVISNCVINLSPEKQRVYKEIFRVLKPGGELYFSDVFSDRRVPESLQTHPILYGECLGGAHYIKDFRRLFRDLGCPDVRIVQRQPIDITNEDVKALVGAIHFTSLTVRAFKLTTLEDTNENYGQTATYLGTIEESPDQFVLDDTYRFIANVPQRICGNTASMLQQTRYQRHFTVKGDRSVHYGLFDTALTDEQHQSRKNTGSGCC